MAEQSVYQFLVMLIRKELEVRYEVANPKVVSAYAERTFFDADGGGIEMQVTGQSGDNSRVLVKVRIYPTVRLREVEQEYRHGARVVPWQLEGVDVYWETEHPDPAVGLRTWHGSTDGRIYLSQVPTMALKHIG